MAGKIESLHVRWMIRRDLMEVVEIEQRCFSFPWTENEFTVVLRERNTIGMVTIDTKSEGEPILGYMVYELGKQDIKILNLAVAPHKQRMGVGTAMINKLKNKLTVQRRNKLSLMIRETNVEAQLFLREKHFRAIDTIHDSYDETDEDAYLMEFARIDKRAKGFGAEKESLL